MDFDDKTCPCPELIEIARRVFREIPQEDQQWIEKVCDRVVFVRGWDAEAEFIEKKAQIRVFVLRMEDFSARAQRGILAHEFGHAYVYSARYEKVGHGAEKLDDMQARLWGFGADLDARNRETARLRDTNT